MIKLPFGEQKIKQLYNKIINISSEFTIMIRTDQRLYGTTLFAQLNATAKLGGH